MYLSNAFSLNMIDINDFTLIRARKIESTDVPQDAISAIGHPDTARVVSGILGREVPANRVNVSLSNDDVLFVAQYRGPRLPEGATVLPEGATLEFMEITIKPEGCNRCHCHKCGYCDIVDWTRGL